ncbi:MAG: hypothetical protein ACOC1K_04055 [Nanoarchaeota archaeon]
MAKQIEFTAKDVKAFTSWLKRFSLIDTQLLFEINESSKEFIAKTYNEERSVVKFSKVKFDDAGFSLKKGNSSERIKVGIYSIPKLLKVIEQFNSDEFCVVFKYEEIINDNDNELVGTSILIKNDSLKVGIECTSLNVFNYIKDDLFLNTIANIDSKISFELDKTSIDKINSLCLLDKDHKFMQFLNKEGSIYAKSKAFELLLSVSSDEEIKIDMLKEQFDKLDGENYSVNIGDDRIVFSSNESDTITVISEVERDDRYEEGGSEDIL